MKSARRRVDVNLDELDQVLDGARQAPLSEADYDKLKGALHALAAMLVRPRPTEKTSAVLEESVGSETGAGSKVIGNAIPEPFYKELLAIGTTGVLEVANFAWDIAGIDVTQPGLPANLCCTHKRLRAGVIRIRHLVVFVKGSDVPRDIR